MTGLNPEVNEHIFTSDPRQMSPDQLQAKMNSVERSYDEELDNPLIHHPKIAKDLEAMSQRYKMSSAENIDAAMEQYELSYTSEETRKQRWAGQKRWVGREAEEMRIVRLLHPYAFLRKLRSAGVDARPEDHKNARMWLNPFTLLGRVGVNARICGEVKTVTTLQYPYAPEYSLMRFNSYDVPTEERFRGWRTTLLCLIVADVITEAEADRAFGPALGPASEFYREQLQIDRRIKAGLEI